MAVGAIVIIGHAAIFELEAVVEAQAGVGIDFVAHAGADAGEGDVGGFAGLFGDIADGAVIPEEEELQAVLCGAALGEKLGEADGRGANFVVDDPALVAVDLAFLVTAHGAETTEAELFAAEEIFIGELGGAAQVPCEAEGKFRHPFECEERVGVGGFRIGAGLIEYGVVVRATEVAGAVVDGEASVGGTPTVRDAGVVAEDELVDVGGVLVDAAAAEIEIVIADLEIESGERFVHERTAAGQRDGVAAAGLPATTLEADEGGAVERTRFRIAAIEAHDVSPRQRNDVAAAMGAEGAEIATGGVLVVDLLTEAEGVAPVETGEVTVEAGELVAGVFVAGEDAQREAILCLQDEIGRAEIFAAGVDEVDGAERIAIEPVEIGKERAGVDVVATLQANFVGE